METNSHGSSIDKVLVQRGNDLPKGASIVQLRQALAKGSVVEIDAEFYELKPEDHGKNLLFTDAFGTNVVTPLGLPIGFTVNLFAIGGNCGIGDVEAASIGLSFNGVLNGTSTITSGFAPATVLIADSTNVYVFGNIATFE